MIPLDLDAQGHCTLQLRIYEQIRSAIVSNRLRPGSPLPSSRDLERDHKLARNTVVLAYKRLGREGYLAMRPGAGTFVADPIPEMCVGLASQSANTRTGGAVGHGDARHETVRHPPVLLRTGGLRMVQAGHSKPQVDFWYGSANARNFPIREWRRLLVENLSRTSSNLSGYGPPEGIHELRLAIARHLSANRGIPVAPDQILITAGAQEGLNLVSRLFVQQGVEVVMENPCYLGAALVFQSFGATIVPAAVDCHGLSTANLKQSAATLAYVTPSHQFPTGVTMSQTRRLQLLDWAQTNGAYIVEDDYDSDFRYDGPPLAALAGLNGNDSVIYLGTFSKSIGSGVRTGYLAVPKQLIEPMRCVKSLANYGHPWLEQIVLAEFIEQGGFARHLRRIRNACGQAREALLESLQEHFGQCRIEGAEAGMHVMWTLPPYLPPIDEIVHIAAAESVGLYTLKEAGTYEMGPVRYPRTLLLGYASLSPDEIRSGIARVADGLRRAGYITRQKVDWSGLVAEVGAAAH
jgi:GntR family transcriptional regulator/MocR family aminotransferase